jgi:hypothetical protein
MTRTTTAPRGRLWISRVVPLPWLALALGGLLWPAEPAPALSSPQALHGQPNPQEPGTGVVEEPILGSPSAIPRQAGSEEFIVVEAGTRLLGSPHPGAPVLDVVQTQIELPLLERLGPWVRVRYGSWRGWILPLGNEELPVSTQTLPEPGEERRLNRARELLGNAARTGNLGPYSLYTDLDDDELLERLAGVATHLTQSYGERYDLEVRLDGSEAVVLFADERDYRDFEAGERSIAGVHTQGFARQGLVVLFVGERDLIATLQALIHELVHVLNRRALGTQIPAWLEEGLAEDLGFSRIQADGRIVVGSLGGDNVPFSTSASRVGSPHAFEIGGPRGSLVALLIEWHEPTRPTLAELVAMPWQEFVESEAGAIHYAESAFLVRYFLDGRRRSLREGFRRYLRSMAAGELNLGETVWTSLEIHHALSLTFSPMVMARRCKCPEMPSEMGPSAPPSRSANEGDAGVLAVR